MLTDYDCSSLAYYYHPDSALDSGVSFSVQRGSRPEKSGLSPASASPQFHLKSDSDAFSPLEKEKGQERGHTVVWADLR